MIRHLRGTIYARTDKSVILDVHGTGYEIFVPQGILMTLAEGQDAALWTHLAVRETSMELFGFQDMQYLVFFEMLLGVSGIGPRSALGIIDIASLETLQKAIAHDDISYLTKVSGIGKRTAEKNYCRITRQDDDIQRRSLWRRHAPRQ
ncbi:MAG: Holliday junction branch migration protein RuvA [Candidatus Pacebacteria bacterium]|nr:Holliday junction branch migration protein RuvA [Candidatus Paceibacterota bacterium]MCD8528297.1 Holliday junction branch migration protein RuvA [Candidatus Paceibacterota bacterium]